MFVIMNFKNGLTYISNEEKACPRLYPVFFQKRTKYLGMKKEAYLEKLHISPYEPATRANPSDPQRRRKLLLNRQEIERMDHRIREKGFTLVPLTVYFRRGRAKVELALARGKQRHDKRATIKERDGDRETRRAMRRHTR